MSLLSRALESSKLARIAVASSSNPAVFAGERPGDVLLYTSCNQRILFGSTPGAAPALSVSASNAAVEGTLAAQSVSVNEVVSTGLRLGIYDPTQPSASYYQLLAPTCNVTLPEDPRLTYASNAAAAASNRLSPAFVLGATGSNAVLRGAALPSTSNAAGTQDVGTAAVPFRTLTAGQVVVGCNAIVCGVPIGGRSIGDPMNVRTDTQVSLLDNSNVTNVPFANFQWSVRVDNSSASLQENVGSVVVDDEGSFYMFTMQDNTLTTSYIPRTGTTQTTLGSPVAVSKFTSNGTLSWIRHTSGAFGSCGIARMAVRSSNLYICGSIANGQGTSWAAWPFSIQTFNLSNLNANYVMCLNTSNSSLQWARYIQGVNLVVNDIAVDSSNNVCVAGRYSSNVVVAYSSNIAMLPRAPDVSQENGFVMKFSATGTPMWGAVMECEGTFHIENATGVDMDTQGNVYVCGSKGGSLSSSVLRVYDALNGSNVMSPITGLSNVTYGTSWLLQFDPNGVSQWAAGLVEPTNTNLGFTPNVVTQGDDVYLLHGFLDATQARVMHASNVTSSISLHPAPNRSACVTKYSRNGQAQWTLVADTSNATTADTAVSAAFDRNSNMYLTGQFFGPASDGTVLGFYMTSNARWSDAYVRSMPSTFVAKIDPQGQPQFVTQLTGGTNTTPRDIAVDPTSGAIYLALNAVGTPMITSNPLATTSNAIFTPSGTWAAAVLRFQESNGPTRAPYRLINGTACNGTVKTLFNRSTERTFVQLRDASNTTTLSNLVLGSNALRTAVHYDRWYVV